MRNFWKTGWVMVVIASLSCHKSVSSVEFSAGLSGIYTEISPVAGESTLNFVSANTVIAGGHFLLETLSAADTLSYFLSAASGDSLISFVDVVSGFKDTLTCNFGATGTSGIKLSFKPCPPGVPCDALAGSVFIYQK